MIWSDLLQDVRYGVRILGRTPGFFVVAVLASAVGLVLLIACTNLSNLLLVRASSRRREMAIRSAMGARRSRLARQMLAESLLLSSGGALVGIVMAHAITREVARTRAFSIPMLESTSPCRTPAAGRARPGPGRGRGSCWWSPRWR